MDSNPEPEREVTRVPTGADLVSLARELGRVFKIGGVSNTSQPSIECCRHPRSATRVSRPQTGLLEQLLCKRFAFP
jgi:hypothetical protein